jgi:hypothetical protein
MNGMPGGILSVLMGEVRKACLDMKFFPAEDAKIAE